MGNAKNHQRKHKVPIDHRDQLSSYSGPQSASDRKLSFSLVQDSNSDSDSESESDVDQTMHLVMDIECGIGAN